MNGVVLDAKVMLEFERLLQLGALSGRGFEEIGKTARKFCEVYGWDWFTAGTKADFNRRFGYVFSAYSYGIHALERRKQLASFPIWIIKNGVSGCPESHKEFHGLALPQAHPVWERLYPPIVPTCSCYVVGTDNEAGVKRMRGHIGKEPPAWIFDHDSEFSVESLLLDIVNGNIPSDD